MVTTPFSKRRTMQSFWNGCGLSAVIIPVYQFRFIPDAKRPRNPCVSARMCRRLAQVRRDVAPQTRRVRHELPPRFHQQADFLLGTRRVAGDVRHRARGARSRRRLVGRRSLHRQSRLVEIAGGRAGDADRRGAGLSQRPGRRALRHARRMEDQLGMARPAAGGVGLHQAPQILRHDHPQGIWRARLLALCAFGSGAQTFLALAHRRRHRDGAELARARRTADALRHQRTAAEMAAAARRGHGHSLLRPDQPGSGLRCGLDGRHRHHLQGQFRRPRSDRPAAELAQALHHAGPGGDAARSRLQGL